MSREKSIGQSISSGAPRQFLALKSVEDDSVNWVRRLEKGYEETRYVRREQRYFVVYLSSQSGCSQGCRMCHLTATHQTQDVDTAKSGFLGQANVVLEWYRNHCPRAEAVHFNFMARGEPLANRDLTANSHGVLSALGERAFDYSLRPRFLISTIMPKSLGSRELIDIFPLIHPEIYYSLYSVNPAFRRRWLPQALPANVALTQLALWQRHTSKLPKIHYAFIEGENDAISDVRDVCQAILDHGLRVNVNVVRYNPAHSRLGVEPPENIVIRNADVFREYLPGARVKVIPRVGADVYASCGMFVD